MTAFSPSASRLNGVGYNTTANEAGDAAFIFGASFNSMAVDGVIPFKDLVCPEGFEDDDQIQTPYTDEQGFTQLRNYYYFGEWLDENYDSVADTDGVELGKSAWFVTSSAKTITTAGEVKKGNFIHTFTETADMVTSAFPVPFCPNSENVSWGVSDDTQIQTAYTDESGFTQLRNYYYFGEWLDENYDSLAADDAVVGPGVGFWFLIGDATETFTEVSPLAE